MVTKSDLMGSIISNNESVANKLSHGTSPRQMIRAMDTYMNVTGPCDYDLPQLIGQRTAQSEFKNNGAYTMKYRTKLSWFPSRHAEF